MPNLYSQSRTSTTVFFRFRTYLLLSLVSFCLVAVPLASAAGLTDVQKARIKADLAAKKPLAQIMKEALALGIPVAELVAVLGNAGVDACAFVTAAVSASSSDSPAAAGSNAIVSETITAAVKVGGTGALTCIVRAARNSGVSTPEILKAATTGGADADAVKALASASSDASGSEAPALGYSAPAPTAGPTTFQPSASPSIGGGGGGAAVNPTKPASPTNPNAQRR